MFSLLRSWLLRILRVPPEPQAPVGDPASTRVFRASPKFYFLRLLGWGFWSGSGVKKAAWNEIDSNISVPIYFFRFNLTNTTCCSYNYLVPQNSVAFRFTNKPSTIFYYFKEQPQGCSFSVWD
jgi:hypothetical protein